jgi:hypothetical protein
MSIQISRETEARLTNEAQRLGISVEVLVERLLTERCENVIAENRPTARLPVWHLGGAGSLHRRDIYDDVG